MSPINKTRFSSLNSREIAIFKRLNTPAKIQDYLEAIPINFEPGGDTCMSPRRVIESGSAHCIEGAMLAAGILWFHGQKPLLLDLKATNHDFDHVVAPFNLNGRWGAISKTNHAVLRWREPVYRDVRELAMSYFHEYFTDDGRKTLLSYSKPFNLSSCGRKDWLTAEDNLFDVAQELDDSPHISIASGNVSRRYRRADPIEIMAGKLTVFKKQG